jgi:hypothetical protein
MLRVSSSRAALEGRVEQRLWHLNFTVFGAERAFWAPAKSPKTQSQGALSPVLNDHIAVSTYHLFISFTNREQYLNMNIIHVNC